MKDFYVVKSPQGFLKRGPRTTCKWVVLDCADTFPTRGDAVAAAIARVGKDYEDQEVSIRKYRIQELDEV